MHRYISLGWEGMRQCRGWAERAGLQKARLTRSFRRLLSGEACAIVSVPSLMGLDETLGSMSSPERWDVSEDHLLGIHNPSSLSIRAPVSSLIGLGSVLSRSPDVMHGQSFLHATFPAFSLG